MPKQGNKTHKTAVVIIPPDELWPPIQAIRREHDRQIRRWMPHITMIYPFRPQEAFEMVADQFSEVCRYINPFEVQLEEFRSFHHKRENYTLWLAPNPQEEIVYIQLQYSKPLTFRCEECGCTTYKHIHDHKQRTWRHKDLCDYKTVLKADVPRVCCTSCERIGQVSVPWAHLFMRITLAFQQQILDAS